MSQRRPLQAGILLSGNSPALLQGETTSLRRRPPGQELRELLPHARLYGSPSAEAHLAGTPEAHARQVLFQLHGDRPHPFSRTRRPHPLRLRRFPRPKIHLNCPGESCFTREKSRLYTDASICSPSIIFSSSPLALSR